MINLQLKLHVCIDMTISGRQPSDILLNDQATETCFTFRSEYFVHHKTSSFYPSARSFVIEHCCECTCFVL